MTDETSHDVATVKLLAGTTQQTLHVKLIKDQLVNFFVAIPIWFEPIKKALHFVVEEVANFFQHGYCITLFLWVLPQLYQFLKQLINVCQVEVTGQNEITGNPVILPQKRVAGFDAVVTVGTVAQVSQQQLAGIGQIILKPLAVGQLFRGQVLKSTHDGRKEVVQVIGRITPPTADVLLSGFYANFDGSQPRAILATVTHFLHEQLPPIEAVKRRTILVLIVI